jgi:hypothetical protein
MRRLFVLITVIFFLSTISNGQGVAINTDNTTADASAVLDVKSNTKGMLVPRMTTAQRTAIVAPAKGLLVFDNTIGSFWFYNGSAWAAVGGGAAFTLPYKDDVVTISTLFEANNAGTGIGIKGTSLLNHGVVGTTASASSAGIRGDATGTNSAGVRGSSSSATGVGVDAFNTGGGLALNVYGNLKIAGGGTNPGLGKTLTSDASGLASWKARRVAFRVVNTKLAGKDVLANAQWGRLYPAVKDYDYGSTFNMADGGADESTFTAPVTGVYHFNVSVAFGQLYVNGNSTEFTEVAMRIMLKKNGVIYTASFFQNINPNGDPESMTISGSDDLKLNATDKVWVEVLQKNNNSQYMYVMDSNQVTIFSGHLVFED